MNAAWPGASSASVRSAVRRAVYDGFLGSGRSPSPAEIAAAIGVAEREVRAALASLHDARELVVEHGSVRMAIPWSGVETSYAVRFGDGARAWVNCAWDALGAAVHLGDVVVEGRDPLPRSPWSFAVQGGEPDLPADAVLHFALPVSSWWEDIGFT